VEILIGTPAGIQIVVNSGFVMTLEKSRKFM